MSIPGWCRRSATQPMSTSVATGASDDLALGLDARLAHDRLRDGRTVYRQSPQLADRCLVGVGAHERLRLDAAIAGVAGIAHARPLPDVLEATLDRDLEVADLDAALGGVEHEADHHVTPNGREDVLVCARGCVGGIKAIRLIHGDRVGPHIGLGAEAALRLHAGAPRPTHSLQYLGIAERLRDCLQLRWM